MLEKKFILSLIYLIPKLWEKGGQGPIIINTDPITMLGCKLYDIGKC